MHPIEISRVSKNPKRRASQQAALCCHEAMSSEVNELCLSTSRIFCQMGASQKNGFLPKFGKVLNTCPRNCTGYCPGFQLFVKCFFLFWRWSPEKKHSPHFYHDNPNGICVDLMRILDLTSLMCFMTNKASTTKHGSRCKIMETKHVHSSTFSHAYSISHLSISWCF